MKIKISDRDVEQVLAMPPLAHKEPQKQSPFFRHLLAFLSRGELKKVQFSCVKENLPDKETPCIFLMNHSSFTDLNISSCLLKDRPYHIICTRDGFVGKEKLMRLLGCIPTDKFIPDVSLVRDMKTCLTKLHSSILLFPEASYSFDGTQTPLPESLSKCLRLMQVPVVMIRTHGAFLRDPLYNNLQKRRVKVWAEMKLLFSKEETASLPLLEIQERLNQAFSYDHFREQALNGLSVTEPFRADGLNRVLYKCPDCGIEGKMLGKGTQIQCLACGKTHVLKEDGCLQAEEGETAFSFVSDWYKWERECVRKEVREGTYLMEEAVDILVLADEKSMYRVGEGVLRQDQEGFLLTGCEGKLHYRQAGSYSLYADYFWYEVGDVISIGDKNRQFYCFPKDQKGALVAKARLAAEESYILKKTEKQKAL